MWMNDIAVSLTNQCSASYVSCQRVTARICCCAPCCGAAGAERRAAIDQHLLPAGRLAANPQQRRAAGKGRTDTNGRTLDRLMDPSSQTMRAVSIGNESVPIQLAQCWFPRLAISNAKI